MINFDTDDQAITIYETNSIESIKRYHEQVAKLCEFALQTKVENEGTREIAANMNAALKQLKKDIKERAQEICMPARDFISKVNGIVNGFLEEIDRAVGHLASEELKYIEYLEMQRREEEKKMKEAIESAQKEIDKKAKELGIEPVKLPDPVAPPKERKLRTEDGVTSYYVKKWVVEVFDASRVPHEYCSPDMKKLQQAVDAGIRNIPGCNIYEKKELRHRR